MSDVLTPPARNGTARKATKKAPPAAPPLTSLADDGTERSLLITPPVLPIVRFDIIGTAPLVQLRFSQKAAKQMMENQLAGTARRKSSKVREARDFEDDFKQSHYFDETNQRYGIPAHAFRHAFISACRLVNFKMVLAKLSIFIEADGYDTDGATPLVHLQVDRAPKMIISTVRNATGVADLRVRANFWPWRASLGIRYDGGIYTQTDIANLLMRVGMQVGIGEGRPDSKDSPGLGWGTFRLATTEDN